MQVIFYNDCHILNWWYISIYFHKSNLIETNYQATSKIRDDKWLVSTKTLTRILYESITVHDEICPNFWLQLVLGTSTWVVWLHLQVAMLQCCTTESQMRSMRFPNHSYQCTMHHANKNSTACAPTSLGLKEYEIHTQMWMQDFVSEINNTK